MWCLWDNVAYKMRIQDVNLFGETADVQNYIKNINIFLNIILILAK